MMGKITSLLRDYTLRACVSINQTVVLPANDNSLASRRCPANENTRGPGGSSTTNAAESRKHEAFESGNPRDAYSSVSHLKGNLDSLSFAIGLREEGGQEGALERLLPMLKIQPRPPGDVRV